MSYSAGTMYKRKRQAYGYGLGYSKGGKLISGPILPPRVAKRRNYVPGVSRVGGYYGRFAPRGGELKFHDIDVDDAVIAAGCNIQNAGTINIIPQGVTEVQRIGRKCTIKQILWRYRVFLPPVDGAAAPASADSVRLIVYLDKQCNGATAVNTGILESNDWQSFRNLANTGRFHILMDKVMNMNSLTLAANQDANVFDVAGVHRSGVFFKKCDIPLEFDAATGALTEVRSNNIGIMICSSNGVAGIDSKVRLRFSDN